ncbi:MAG: phosphatidate cytidylyltransferase [Mycoplasma sp.]
MRQTIVKSNVNKLNSKTKKTFKVRTFSSVLVAFFILLSFTFSVLSETKWGWSGGVGIVVNQVFAYLQLALMLVVISFSAIEITNLHFYKNKPVLILVFISMLIVTYLPTLVYFGNKFNYFQLTNSLMFLIYIATLLVCLTAIIIVNGIVLLLQGLVDVKKIFVHLLLIVLVALFINAWLYFSFSKGWTTMLILYAITAGVDTFAYLGGMLFGKQKMSPHISPNKTIGGGIIGVLMSVIICVIFLVSFAFIPGDFNILGNFFGIVFKQSTGTINGINDLFLSSAWWWVCVVSILLVLGVVAIVGDLSYSYIKRTYGIKDFSNLIPGHGGMLDRIDSLTFVVSLYFVFSILISLFSTTAGFF